METQFRIEEWLVDPLHGRIIGSLGSVRLEPRVMRVLLCLADRCGTVVSREELIQQVWEGVFVTDEVLTQSVSELRKALNDETREPRFIQTIPKQGYRLIVPVTAIPAPAATSAETVAEPPTVVAAETKHVGRAQRDAEPRAPSTGRQRLARVAWTSLFALFVLLTVLWGTRALETTRDAPEVRFEIDTPPTHDPSVAFSPDGSEIVFVALRDKVPQLWLRRLGSQSARPLAGTEGASSPFWSPDSRSIGFFADTKLKRMELDTGSVKTLVPGVPLPLGGTWNGDDTILFSGSPGRPILRVSASGGEPSLATRIQSPHERSHSFPHFLPDGRHFLFFVSGSLETRGVYVGQIDRWDTKRLLEADVPAVYAGNDHLLFVREGTLFGQDFDPDFLRLQGAPFPIAQQMSVGASLSASSAGSIAYRTPSADRGQRQLLWVTRNGRKLETVVYRDDASQGPSLSHDGGRVALFRNVNGNMDIWTYEIRRRLWERVTFDIGDDIFPLWSPDDRSIVFGSRRREMNLYRKLLSTPAGSEEILLSTSEPKFPMDWSRDGRFLLYDSIHPERGFDIWALPLTEDGEPLALVQTRFNERLPQFSPDGKWIAYQSDRTGRFEIYLRRFPLSGGDSAVSVDGGEQVRWSPDGTELFYVAADDQLMAVPIRRSSDGETVEPDTPRALFPTNIGSRAINTNRHQYAVSPDGQGFLVNSLLDEAVFSPISVILNWTPKLPPGQSSVGSPAARVASTPHSHFGTP